MSAYFIDLYCFVIFEGVNTVHSVLPHLALEKLTVDCEFRLKGQRRFLDPVLCPLQFIILNHEELHNDKMIQ